MKIKDVKNKVLEILAPFAEENNLKIRKGEFSLDTKKGVEPSASMWFTYETWGFEVDLHPFISVEHKVIRDICSMFGADINFTSFINLYIWERIVNEGWHRWFKWEIEKALEDTFIIVDGEEWEDRFAADMERLCPLAKDYIELASTIKGLDFIYNSFPMDEMNPHCSGDNIRALVGLISAKLSNNPKYEAIREAYSEMADKGDFRKDNEVAFYKIRDYLDTLP